MSVLHIGFKDTHNLSSHLVTNLPGEPLLLKFQGNALLIHIPGQRHMTEELFTKLTLAFRPPV